MLRTPSNITIQQNICEAGTRVLKSSHAALLALNLLLGLTFLLALVALTFDTPILPPPYNTSCPLFFLADTDRPLSYVLGVFSR